MGAPYKIGQFLTGDGCALEYKEMPALPGFDLAALAAMPDGYVAGIASAPSIDLQGHRVLAGAFDQSIKERGLWGRNSVKLMAWHDPRKIAGVIKELKTVNGDLRIGAQLNLNKPVGRELYEDIKDTGGLSFSVGFTLQDFRFAEDEITKQEYLEVQKGDLAEVSIVAFPAQPAAGMDFYKSAETPSEFERALIEYGWVRGRNEAHKLMQFCKASIGLLGAPMQVKEQPPPPRPMLDASQLQAATDLLRKTQAVLGLH